MHSRRFASQVVTLSAAVSLALWLVTPDAAWAYGAPGAAATDETARNTSLALLLLVVAGAVAVLSLLSRRRRRARLAPWEGGKLPPRQPPEAADKPEPAREVYRVQPQNYEPVPAPPTNAPPSPAAAPPAAALQDTDLPGSVIAAQAATENVPDGAAGGATVETPADIMLGDARLETASDIMRGGAYSAPFAAKPGVSGPAPAQALPSELPDGLLGSPAPLPDIRVEPENLGVDLPDVTPPPPRSNPAEPSPDMDPNTGLPLFLPSGPSPAVAASEPQLPPPAPPPEDRQ